MLTPEQKKQLERTTSARIERARQAVAVLQGRRLSREHAEVLSQIRTFLQQAEEARSSDLVRAGNLAERADVLAQDLLNSTR
jgi:hypothetical protein